MTRGEYHFQVVSGLDHPPTLVQGTELLLLLQEGALPGPTVPP